MRIKPISILGLFAGFVSLVSHPVAIFADGEVGEHVNNMQEHLENYEDEIVWFLDELQKITSAYEGGGSSEYSSEMLIDNWEAVDFHAAIEINYIQIYASIWQGIYSVKASLDGGEDPESVDMQEAGLQKALWQGLGAVKLAARFQSEGLVGTQGSIDSRSLSPSETLDAIKSELDRALAKSAERLPDEATDIVLGAYLELFEGLEGDLITLDAELVEDLEKDFNVTLPQALSSELTLDSLNQVVSQMKSKLDRSKELIQDAEESRRSVF